MEIAASRAMPKAQSLLLHPCMSMKCHWLATPSQASTLFSTWGLISLGLNCIFLNCRWHHNLERKKNFNFFIYKIVIHNNKSVLHIFKLYKTMQESSIEALKFHANVMAQCLDPLDFWDLLYFFYYLHLTLKTGKYFCFQTLKIQNIVTCCNDMVVREPCSGWLQIFEDCFIQWKQ